MGRREQPIDEHAPAGELAAGLRRLRHEAGRPSWRLLAQQTHYSHTTLSDAASGQRMPSLEVVLAIVAACGGDRQEWTQRWHDAAGRVAPAYPPAGYADAPWPEQDVADGADPEAARCSRDAVTAHARKLAIAQPRLIVGTVELRYSPSRHAAWARFEGFTGLDHIASQKTVDIAVSVTRHSDGQVRDHRERYNHDYHWCDILMTCGAAVHAAAVVYIDSQSVAQSCTEILTLK